MIRLTQEQEQEQKILKPSQVLKQFKGKHIRNNYADGKQGYCAIGALLKYYFNYEATKTNYANFKEFVGFKARLIDEIFNGDTEAIANVYFMNDSFKRSLNEIAEYLEKRGL